MSARAMVSGRVRAPALGWLIGDRAALWIAALAFAVYVPAIGWGLPVATSSEVIHGWDVDGIAGVAPLAEFQNLLIEASPDWYVAYPLFHYLLLGASYAPYLGWLWLTGGLEAPGAAYPFGLVDPVGAIAAFASIGRALTLLMAVGTVLAAYRTALVVWNRQTGVVAALLAMLSLPMVYRARTGNLDVPVLFWTALGILVLAHVSVGGLTVKRAIGLGAFAALATATKDQAYGGWVVAILAVVVLHWRSLLPAGDRPVAGSWKAPAAIIGSGLAVYVAAGGVVLNPGRYLAHMQFILTYEEARFLFEETGLERGRDLLGMTQLAGDIAWTTIVAMGIPAAAVALAGIWTARRARFVWLLGAMAFGYLALVMIPIAHMQLRYALLPAYLLSFPAAQWIVYAWNRPGRWRPVACAGGALAIAWMLAGAFNITYQMLFDARYEAGEWLSANLMSGQSVGFFGDRGQLPPIPEGVVVERFEGGDTARSDLEAAGVDLVLIVPDYTTPVGGERSLFLPADTYAALSEGLLPYASAAHFETEPPWGARGRGRGRYPFVNPPVRIFIRSQSREAGTSAPR